VVTGLQAVLFTTVALLLAITAAHVVLTALLLGRLDPRRRARRS
jgi:hypothetical protein